MINLKFNKKSDMKKVIILGLVAVSMVFASCNSSTKNDGQSANETQKFDLDTMKLLSGQTFYQCEMHHQINSDIMGQCPTCKMDLTKLTKH